MKCKHFINKIPLHYYEELKGEENIRFLKHINECRKCESLYKAVTYSLKNIPQQHHIQNNLSDNQKLSEKIKTAYKKIEGHKVNQRRLFLSKDFIYTLSACLFLTVLMHNFILPGFDNNTNLNYASSMNSAAKVKGIKYRSIYLPKTMTDIKESEESIMIINSFKNIAFKDNDVDVQISSVAALGRLGSPYAIVSLIDIANNHPNPNVRRAAIVCLTNYLEKINNSYSRFHGII